MTALFNKLEDETLKQLDSLVSLINKTFPLPSKYSRAMPYNISTLSRLLTADRSQRKDGYLGESAMLQAYLRYFLPWNVYKLCKLFSSKEINCFLLEIFLDENADVIDLGSGPFTLPVAFWISFPQLRTKKINFFCIDHNKSALQAGKKLFCAVAGQDSTWNIKTLNADIKEKLKLRPASLVTAINLFNEIFWALPQADNEKIKQFTMREAKFLSNITTNALLVVEPGIPRSASFISNLKEALAENNINTVSPCPANTVCQIKGGKKGSKWCHFNFEADDSPKELQKLSSLAGLSKEKVVLSFLLASKKNIKVDTTNARVVSDLFTLPGNKTGVYACSQKGLLLIICDKTIKSGMLLEIPQGKMNDNLPTDKKSGAKIIDLSK